MLAVVTALAAAGVAQAQVTEEDLANDATSVGDVLTNGMGRDLQRYSPLETLNKTNVKKLVPAWALSLGGEKQRGQEAQPIVHDGVMYVTGSYSRSMPSTSRPARSCGSSTPGCPRASCPAAT